MEKMYDEELERKKKKRERERETKKQELLNTDFLAFE